MKNRANSALALTLAIACAVAAPLRSDARSGSCGCGESRQPLAKQAFRGACAHNGQALRKSYCKQLYIYSDFCNILEVAVKRDYCRRGFCRLCGNPYVVCGYWMPRFP